MVAPKSYSLALEIDRSLKLSLNNSQFDRLASFLDGYQDSQKMADNLMRGSQGDILAILDSIRRLSPDSGK
jgi:hypothetical protein